MSDVKEDQLNKAVEAVKGYAPQGVKVEGKVANVTKETEVKALVDHVEAWGGVDSAVYSAGIMHGDDDGATNTSEQIWDLTQAINVKGVWYGCKHAINSMLKNNKKDATIVNVASFVAIRGAATPQIAYTASKGAVLAMTREMAICYARQGIRINALCPGPLNTPLLQEFLDNDEKKLRRTVHLPMGRFGEAIEQAKALVFLSSDESSYIIGQDFLVDGGLAAAYVTDTREAPAGPQNEIFGK